MMSHVRVFHGERPYSQPSSHDTDIVKQLGPKYHLYVQKSLVFSFQPFKTLYLEWLRNCQESYGGYLGLGAVSDHFVWEVANLGAVFQL